MSTITRSRRLAVIAAFVFPLIVFASAPPPAEEDESLEEIVTTGMRVSQGGAQDIKFFRGEVEFERIPHPNDLTAEGLMSEHDIVFASAEPCRQLFCVTGEATKADLIAVPHARHLAGIGFATDIDEKTWRRDPVNLIAVVDKSGSMDGTPLELVRKSLAVMARQLKPSDQLTIVLYGDESHVHLQTTRADRAGVARILESIGAIASAGSTSMEAGLRLGYDIAHTTAPAFAGRTRLILFTDERPNTDATDAESFMGMAEAASRNGVGLTTVGVGVQFNAELATRIGSVRGGNLYFLRHEEDVRELFTGQLDYMVSELAHDLRLTITPAAGLKVSGVYGVPGQLLGWQNGNQIQITLPTVFLDNRGGALFVALAPESADAFLPERPPTASLLEVEVTYLPLKGGGSQRHSVSIGARPEGPSQGMRLGHLLIDEFAVLHEATSAHYLRNDRETAYQLVSRFKQRLDASTLAGLDEEKKLLDSLHTRIAFLSGHGGTETRATPFTRLWGRWKVERVHGEVDFERGQLLEFTADNDLHVTGARKDGTERDETEDYQSNNKQIYLPESELVFHYSISGDKLTLHHRRSGVWVRLKREVDG
jgi:Ca-activated chloride channel homolog